MTMKTVLFAWTIVFGAAAVADAAWAATPSFDCSRAEGAVETLVCQDPELAALDRETARLFTLARDGPHMTRERRRELIATQRGWIKGRNDCWKADDLRRCVFADYMMRIMDLRQGYANARSRDDEGTSSGPFAVSCAGGNWIMGLVFVSGDPSAALLEGSDRSWVLTLSRSASGARYTGEDGGGQATFWIKGNTARFELPDRALMTCEIEQIG